MNNLLSKRAKVSITKEDFWSKYFELCESNSHEELCNIDLGYVDLGTTVNHTCDFALNEKFKQLREEREWDLLHNASDPFKLRKAMAEMMTQCFETSTPISASNLVLINGVSSSIDLMAHCLAEEGEVFLVPTPMCGRSLTDLTQKALVEIVPIPIMNENGTTSLTVEKVSSAYETAISMKKTVRAVFLSNPNIMGDIYPAEHLRDILIFCKMKSLHLLSDETLALSTHSTVNQFNSVLKFKEVPDTERIHVLYGLNKDFGLPGLGIGIIYTKCRELQENLARLSGFENSPPPFTGQLAYLLEDSLWMNEYVLTNRQRLAKLHQFCIDYLETNNFRVRSCVAGCSLWVDLSPFCGKNFEGERKLFEYLLKKHKLFIFPGEQSLCPIPGFFKIEISQKLTVLQIGFKRFTEALKNYKP